MLDVGMYPLEACAKEWNQDWRVLLQLAVDGDLGLVVRIPKGEAYYTETNPFDGSNYRSSIRLDGKLAFLKKEVFSVMAMETPPWSVWGKYFETVDGQDEYPEFYCEQIRLDLNCLWVPKGAKKSFEERLLEERSPEDGSRKIKREQYTMLIWQACCDKESELKKKATSFQIWKHLQSNLQKYDPDKTTFKSMDSHTLVFYKDNTNTDSITRENLRHTLRRLRKNPPRKK